jgi:hypothetical protein
LNILARYMCLFFLLLFGAGCASAPAPDIVFPASITPSPVVIIQPADEVQKEIPRTALYTQTAPPAASISDCPDYEKREIALEVAKEYSISYAQVTGWLCADIDFEDVLLALETAKEVNIPVEILLQKRLDGQSWEEIWLDVGLIE